jgi:hypothetical protein
VVEPLNPFEPPRVELGLGSADTASGPEDERVRRELLNHEVSIQAVGRLMMLGGVLGALAALSLLVAGVQSPESEPGLMLGLGAAYLVVSVLSLWIGNQLRTLNPSGRIPGALVNGLGLIGFPVGTLISSYILYLLLSRKGRRVLSAEYQGIVARTPHIRYKTPLIIVLLFGLLVILALAALLIPAWR